VSDDMDSQVEDLVRALSSGRRRPHRPGVSTIFMTRESWKDLKRWASGKGDHRHTDMGLSTSVSPQDGYLKLSGRDIPDWEVTLDQGLAVAKVIRRAKDLGAAGVRLTPDSAVVLWKGRPRRDAPHFEVELVYGSGVERSVRVPRVRFHQLAAGLLPAVEEAIVQSVMGSSARKSHPPAVPGGGGRACRTHRPSTTPRIPTGLRIRNG
jgi:hypothetical protein